MKALMGMFCLVAAGGLTASCSMSDDVPAASPELEARTTAAEAANRVAAARCEREQKCENIGPEKRHASVEQCLSSVHEGMDRELGGDEDCKKGVLMSDLEQCLSETREQDCSGPAEAINAIGRAKQCSSSDLCLD